MKKALIYALALALAFSLIACGQSKTEQPTDPAPSTSAPEPIATPEPIKDTTPEPEPEQTPAAPVETEDTQPPEETESEEVESQVEEVQLFTDCNETVYATGTVNLRTGAGTSFEKVGSLNKGDSVTRTGIGTAEAEGWSRIQLSDGSMVYVSSNYISTTKPVVQQQQQQTSKPSGGSSTQTQPSGTQQQQPQQPSEPQGGGGDSAADIEARKQAFLNGMNQMFEDNGYSTSGEDHNWTEEEKQALINSVGGVVGG